MAAASLPTPILSDAILSAPSPSSRDGVPAEREAVYREFGCELIAEMCVTLRVPPAVRATASTLLHRFLWRRSLRAFDVHHVAMAAVFLASKVEESMRRMRDVVNVCYAAKQRRTHAGAAGLETPSIRLGGTLYTNWKAALMRVERFILKDVGFQVHGGVSAQHPHTFILFFVRVLGGGAPLAQMAWAALNDALQTDLCVRVTPEAIACAAIYIASRQVGHPLPTAPWARVFGSDEDEVMKIASVILALRARTEPIGWLPSLRPDWSLADDEDEPRN